MQNRQHTSKQLSQSSKQQLNSLKENRSTSRNLTCSEQHLSNNFQCNTNRKHFQQEVVQLSKKQALVHQENNNSSANSKQQLNIHKIISSNSRNNAISKQQLNTSTDHKHADTNQHTLNHIDIEVSLSEDAQMNLHHLARDIHYIQIVQTQCKFFAHQGIIIQSHFWKTTFGGRLKIDPALNPRFVLSIFGRTQNVKILQVHLVVILTSMHNC